MEGKYQFFVCDIDVGKVPQKCPAVSSLVSQLYNLKSEQKRYQTVFKIKYSFSLNKIEAPLKS